MTPMELYGLMGLGSKTQFSQITYPHFLHPIFFNFSAPTASQMVPNLFATEHAMAMAANRAEFDEANEKPGSSRMSTISTSSSL